MSPDRATINDLCALVITDYTVRKLRDAAIVKWRYEANIKPAIGNLLAARFGASQVRAFVSARREAGASDPTINRELSIIRRGFRLGFEEDPPIVRRVPHILKLDEDNARQGFLTPRNTKPCWRPCPSVSKPYSLSRIMSEHERENSARSSGPRWTLMRSAFGCRRPDQRQKGARIAVLRRDGALAPVAARTMPEGCQWVFFHNSRPVGAQLRGWREACEAAGVPALLFTTFAGRQYATCASPGSTKVCG